MRIEIEAILLGTQDIHSAKSGKDFKKINLIIEGEFCGFFTRKQDGERISTTKPFAELAKTKNPQRCVATLDVKFTQRGIFTDLIAVM